MATLAEVGRQVEAMVRELVPEAEVEIDTSDEESVVITVSLALADNEGRRSDQSILTDPTLVRIAAGRNESPAKFLQRLQKFETKRQRHMTARKITMQSKHGRITMPPIRPGRRGV